MARFIRIFSALARLLAAERVALAFPREAASLIG
jgi:hypothetical protein